MNAGELLFQAYTDMHEDIVDGVATGGSATVIQDSSLANKYPLNKFKKWIAFINRTTDGLTPQNKFSKITAYDGQTGYATIDTVTDTVDSGDIYAFCKATVPIYTMLELANRGLKKLGRIWNNDVSLTTAADTRRYTLPLAVTGIVPRAIYLIESDYTRLDTPPYRIIPAAGGTADTLEFSGDPAEGKTINIDYMGIHPTMTAYNSYVNGRIHPELAVAAVLERAYWWKCQPKRRKVDLENWGQAKALLAEAKRDHPMQMPTVEQQRVPISFYN